MSILSAVLRTRPDHLDGIAARAASMPGVDVALNPGDGRLVLVIEDAQTDDRVQGAGETLALITTWPEVLNTSLVWEYSGPDAPAVEDSGVRGYRDWRGSLAGPAPTQQSLSQEPDAALPRP